MAILSNHPPPDDGEDQAAVSMGRRGGAARAAGMTAERQVEIATMVVAERQEA